MDCLSIFSVKPQQYSGSHLDHYRPLAVPMELSIALEQLNKTASSVGFYIRRNAINILWPIAKEHLALKQ